MRIARSLIVMFVAASAVSACGSSSSSNSEASTPIAQDSTSEPATAVEAAFVPLASGAQLDFNSLRGQDVLLWFWAPW